MKQAPANNFHLNRPTVSRRKGLVLINTLKKLNFQYIVFVVDTKRCNRYKLIEISSMQISWFFSSRRKKVKE